MTRQEVEAIVDPLRRAEDLVLAAIVRYPDSAYELHDCKIAIWKAIEEARKSQDEIEIHGGAALIKRDGRLTLKQERK